MGETTQPTKNVVTGNDFAKLTKKALKLGATSLDYSNRKHCKYFVILNNGKKIHFGNPKYEDYLIHHDEERRKKYLARAKKITNKQKLRGYSIPVFTEICQHYLEEEFGPDMASYLTNSLYWKQVEYTDKKGKTKKKKD
ncbi:unnamed protein product [Porites lobata]|uniref:Uncharacterized protein n=1 Tax=Porites lobata TaxID=104759 RepID=A0ABN8QE38_9CNID|nr:unnamed protein product [Porites lobata]